MIAFVVAALLKPAWFDTTLAGYAFTYDEKHSQAAVYDPARGYYVMRSVDCDGAYITLTLTKDRNVMADNGYLVPGFMPKQGENGTQTIMVKPIPSLRTGKGVTIGDGIESVRRRLGKGGRVTKHGRFEDLVYKLNEDEGDGAVVYEERYTFKNGGLIEVEFSLSSDVEG